MQDKMLNKSAIKKIDKTIKKQDNSKMKLF